MSRRLRIAIVSSTFTRTRPGGVPTYVDGRAAHLRRHCEVRVYALGPQQHAGAGGTPLGAHERFRRSVLLVWCRLLLELWRYRPHRIEVHNIPVGLPLLLLGFASYFFHGPAGQEARLEGAGPLSSGLVFLLERLVLRRATKVYVVSDAYARLVRRLHGPAFASGRRLLRRYPRLSGMAAAPADDGPPAGETWHDDERGLTLVCVRRLVRRTGVLELVEAYVQAVSDGRLPASTTLHIVGEGPLQPAIEARARRSPHVRLVVHGRLDDPTRDALYRLGDVNIVPTQALEGFGLVVVEAALQGCPSLVTDVGALPEVVARLDHMGSVCAPDVASLSAALARLRRPAVHERVRLARLAAHRFAVSST